MQIYKKKPKGALLLPRFSHWKLRMKHSKRAEEAAHQLIQGSRLKTEFFVMSGLSGILAALGILLNSTAILIGAMVLAPLLNPVLAFAAGIFLFHRGLIVYATKSFFGGLLCIIAVSALLAKGLLLTGHALEENLMDATVRFQQYNSYILIAAFVSGFAAVYSWLRPMNNLNLVGVAIAVSLIPFVSFLGMLIGAEKFEALNLLAPAFSFNLILIILGAMVAYLVLGFSRARKEVNSSIAHSKTGE